MESTKLNEAVNSKGEVVYSLVAIHPGEYLKDELEARKITRRSFCDSINASPTTISDIVNGYKPMTARIAIRLEELWDIPAEFWMKAQIRYDLIQERKKLAQKER